MHKSCSQNEHTGFKGEKKFGQMKGEKQCGQVIGEKQSNQAQIHNCHAMSLVR